MFDSHAHLTSLPEVGARVDGWIVPGVDAVTDARAPRMERVWRAVGLHPWYLDGDLEEKLRRLRKRAEEPGLVAIGETGLDGMRRAGPRDRQEVAFAAQIELAKERDLPLILHVVRRHGACIDALARAGFPRDLGGMVHDFGGPTEMIERWVETGFKLSISPRSVGRKHREPMIAAIPDHALLVETDDFGTERLGEVVSWVARARGVTPEAVAEITERNARELFGLE